MTACTSSFVWGRLAACGGLLTRLERRLNNRRLEFLHFLSGRSGDHLLRRGVNAERSDEFRMFHGFFP